MYLIAVLTIDNNSQQNSDVKKIGVKCIGANGRYAILHLQCSTQLF